MPNDICDVTRCRQPETMGYAARRNVERFNVCDHHWYKHCDPGDPFSLKTCKLKRGRFDVRI